MESLEMSARTVEEAIRLALEQLNLSREEVEVSILKEGRSGIFGLGTEEAVVRVTPLVPVPETDAGETARVVLEKLLTLLGVTASVAYQHQPVVEDEKEAVLPIAFDIKGDDPGILIGRRGQTLDCLQYVLRLIVSHQTKTWVSIVLDVEGYRQRRYQELEVFARHMADQVRAKKVSFTLAPMPASERRIVHLALANDPGVTTQSIGESELRKVVILPKEA